MKPVGHMRGSQDTDIFRKEVIERKGKPLSAVPGGGQKIHNLPLSVRPGISAARPPQPNSFTGESGEGRFQRSLDSRLVKLQLEAVVIGPFIFDPEGYPSMG